MCSFVRAQVSLDKLDVETLKAFATAGGEVIKHANLVTIGQKSAHEVMADKAAASGNKCT
jgi:hypothetical protein